MGRNVETLLPLIVDCGDPRVTTACCLLRPRPVGPRGRRGARVGRTEGEIQQEAWCKLWYSSVQGREFSARDTAAAVALCV